MVKECAGRGEKEVKEKANEIARKMSKERGIRVLVPDKKTIKEIIKS